MDIAEIIKKLTELAESKLEEWKALGDEAEAEAKIKELKELVEKAKEKVKSWPDDVVFDEEKLKFFLALKSAVNDEFKDTFDEWKRKGLFEEDYGKFNEVLNIFQIPDTELRDKLDKVGEAAGEWFVNEIQKAAGVKGITDRKIWSWWEAIDGGPTSLYKEYNDNNWKNNIKGHISHPIWKSIAGTKFGHYDRTLEYIKNETTGTRREFHKVEEITIGDKGILDAWEGYKGNFAENNGEREEGLGWSKDNCLAKNEKEAIKKYIEDKIKDLNISEDKKNELRDKFDYVGSVEDKKVWSKIKKLDAYTIAKKRTVTSLMAKSWQPEPATGDPSTWVWGRPGTELGEPRSHILTEAEGTNLTGVREKIVDIVNKFIREQINSVEIKTSQLLNEMKDNPSENDEGRREDIKLLNEILKGEEYVSFLSSESEFKGKKATNYLKVNSMIFGLKKELGEVDIDSLLINKDWLIDYWGLKVLVLDNNAIKRLRKLIPLKQEDLANWRADEDNDPQTKFTESEKEVAINHVLLQFESIKEDKPGHKDKVKNKMEGVYNFNLGYDEIYGYLKERINQLNTKNKNQGKAPLNAKEERYEFIGLINELSFALKVISEAIKGENLLGGEEKNEGSVSNEEAKLKESAEMLKELLSEKERAGINFLNYAAILADFSWFISNNAEEEKDAADKRGTGGSTRSLRSLKSQGRKAESLRQRAQSYWNKKVFGVTSLEFAVFLDILVEQLEQQHKISVARRLGTTDQAGDFLSAKFREELNKVELNSLKRGKFISFFADPWSKILTFSKESLEKALTGEREELLKAGLPKINKSTFTRIKQLKGDFFEDLGEIQRRKTLTRSYTREIAKDKIFDQADEVVKLCYFMDDLDQVENYLFVGNQNKKLTEKGWTGGVTRNEAVINYLLNNLIPAQEWEVINEEKLKEKLKGFWGVKTEEEGEWNQPNGLRKWVEGKLEFSEKEIRNLEACAVGTAEPQPFEGSRVQQIYLAALMILKDYQFKDDPNLVGSARGETEGFGYLPDGSKVGGNDSFGHAGWIRRLEDQIDIATEKLGLKKLMEEKWRNLGGRIGALEKAAEINKTRLWKEAPQSGFKALFNKFASAAGEVKQVKEMERYNLGGWVEAIGQFLNKKSRWIENGFDIIEKQGPNFFTEISKITIDDQETDLVQEEIFLTELDAAGVTIEGFSKRKADIKIARKEALKYRKVLALDNLDPKNPKWKEVKINGTEAARAYLSGWLPEDLGFRITSYNGTKPKLVPVVIVKEERFDLSYFEKDITEGEKIGMVGESDYKKIISTSKPVNWKEAVEAKMRVLVREAGDWGKNADDYKKIKEKLEKKIEELEKEKVELEELKTANEAFNQEEQQTELEKLNKELKGLGIDLMGGTKDSGEKERELKELEKKLRKKIKKLRAGPLKSQFEALDAEILRRAKEARERLERGVVLDEEELKRLEKENDELNNQIRNLEDSNEKIRRLKGEVKRLKNEIKEDLKTFPTWNLGLINSSKKKLEEKIKELKEADARFGTLEAEVKTNQEKITKETRVKLNTLFEERAGETQKARIERWEAASAEVRENWLKARKEGEELYKAEEEKITDLEDSVEEIRELKEEINRDLLEKVEKGEEISLLEVEGGTEEDWENIRNKDITEINEKVNKIKETVAKIEEVKKNLVVNTEAKLKNNEESLKESEAKLQKVKKELEKLTTGGDRTKFKVLAEIFESNLKKGSAYSKNIKTLKKAEIELNKKLKAAQADLGKLKDTEKEQKLAEIAEISGKIKLNQQKMANLESENTLFRYFLSFEKIQEKLSKHKPEKADEIKLFKEPEKFKNLNDGETKEKEKFVSEYWKLKSFLNTYQESQAGLNDKVNNDRRFINHQNPDGSLRNPQDFKTLQGWLEYVVQWKKIDWQNLKELDLNEVMGHREDVFRELSLPKPPKLQGGNLDLRGFKNLEILIIPDDILETKITSIDISDCPKLGFANEIVKRANGRIWALEREAADTSLTAEERDIAKRVESTEKLIPAYENKGIHIGPKAVDFDFFRTKTDYDWLKGIEAEKAKEEAQWEDDKWNAERNNKDDFDKWNDREFNEESVEFGKEAGGEKQIQTLKEYLIYHYGIDKKALAETEFDNGCLDIDEINEKRRDEKLPELEGILIDSKKPVEEKNIAFPTAFKKLKKIRYKTQEFTAPEVEAEPSLKERVDAWRMRAEAGNVLYADYFNSTIDYAKWLWTLEHTVDADKVLKEGKIEIKDPNFRLELEEYAEVWEKFQKLYPGVKEADIEKHLGDLRERFAHSLIFDIVNESYTKNKAEEDIVNSNQQGNKVNGDDEYVEKDDYKREPGVNSESKIARDELLSNFNLNKTGVWSIQDLIDSFFAGDNAKRFEELVNFRKLILRADELMNKVGVTAEAAAKQGPVNPEKNEVAMEDWAEEALKILEEMGEFYNAEGCGDIKKYKTDEGEEYEGWCWDEKCKEDSAKKWAYKVYNQETNYWQSTDFHNALLEVLRDYWIETAVDANVDGLNNIESEVKKAGMRDGKVEVMEGEGPEAKKIQVPGWKMTIEEVIKLRRLIIEAQDALKISRDLLSFESEIAYLNRYQQALKDALGELKKYKEETEEEIKGIKWFTNEWAIKEENKFDKVWDKLEEKILDCESKLTDSEDFMRDALKDEANFRNEKSLEVQETRLKKLEKIESDKDSSAEKRDIWGKNAGAGDVKTYGQKITDFLGWLKPLVEARKIIRGEWEKGISSLNWEDKKKLLKDLEKLQVAYQTESDVNKKKAWDLEKDEVKNKISEVDTALKNAFVGGFKNKGGTKVASLVNDDILKFRKIPKWVKGVGTDNSIVYEFEGQKVGKFFVNGWEDPKEFVADASNTAAEPVLRVLYNGETHDGSVIEKANIEKEIWLAEFAALDSKSMPLSPATKTEYLKFWKDGIRIPATEAWKVKNNGWAGDEFEWDGANATTKRLELGGQFDFGLDALTVEKMYLEKVNEVITKIKNAKSISGLALVKWSHYLDSSRDDGKLPPRKKVGDLDQLWKEREAQLKAIEQVKSYWGNLGMSGSMETVLGSDWVSKIESKTGGDIATEETRLKDLIKGAKVFSDIADIKTALAQKPVVADSSLKNSNYAAEMVSLAEDDTKRKARKAAIMAEIKGLRDKKLAGGRAIIAEAKAILAKDDATKEEVEKVIADLKGLVSAKPDSAEKVVWAEKSSENQKLLTDLEAKLVKINTVPEPEKEGPSNLPPTPPPSPTPEAKDKEKFGKDYAELKEVQKLGRRAIVENWKKEVSYSRKKTCQYCPKEFEYSKSLEFLAATQKVETELKNHENSCSFKEKPEEVKKVKQDEWEKVKKSTERHFYACRKCWGKIELDKKVKDWEDAKKQGRADLAYHEEHECGSEATKKIAIYFSPNQGGNEHASLDYADKIKESELTLEKDNQGAIYQEEQVKPTNNNENSINWALVLISIDILLALVLLGVWLMKGNKKKVKKEKE